MTDVRSLYEMHVEAWEAVQWQGMRQSKAQTYLLHVFVLLIQMMSVVELVG